MRRRFVTWSRPVVDVFDPADSEPEIEERSGVDAGEWGGQPSIPSSARPRETIWERKVAQSLSTSCVGPSEAGNHQRDPGDQGRTIDHAFEVLERERRPFLDFALNALGTASDRCCSHFGTNIVAMPVVLEVGTLLLDVFEEGAGTDAAG